MMLAFFGYLLALLVGVTLGLIGSGGSILTIPILHYFLHLSSAEATSHSMFIVGASALFTLAINKRGRGFNTLLLKATIPSVIGVLLARRWVFPSIPDPIRLGNMEWNKDNVFMLVFALLMLLSALNMIRSSKAGSSTETKEPAPAAFALTMAALGFLTGMLGAGGGFLIVPALVLLLNQKMEEAVVTSLSIIAINTMIGFGSDFLSGLLPNYTLLFVFTALSMAGAVLGVRWRKITSPEKLKKGFGWFVLLVGTAIILAELA